MSNQYLSLSPSDFENLAADLLSAVHTVHFERYGEGRDGGVDCKLVTNEGEVWIGQAKRYKDTKALLRQMSKEHDKMLQQPKRPTRYFLVTSCSLSPDNKAEIQQIMHPFIVSTGDIYSAEDLDALLDKYPVIYRKHHRLWLHSIEQLNQYLQHAHYRRNEVTYERIINESKSYVPHSAEQEINQQLAERHYCLLIGDPSIGKSITAGQVALRHMLDTPDGELIWVDDRNFEQVLQLVRIDSPQIIVMDDFLGATFLHDEGILTFQRDWQALLRLAQRGEGKVKLLFTTRDYILEQARTKIDFVRSPLISELCKRAVRLEHNNVFFRAELVYSLLRQADLDAGQMALLVQEGLYWPLIKADNFSPRLIQMLCAGLADIADQDLSDHINQVGKGLHQLWLQASQRLSLEAQSLLYLCAITGRYANVTDIKRAFYVIYKQQQGRVAPINSFDRALIELEPLFIKTEEYLNEIWLNPVNPSLIDFLHKDIVDNPPLIDALINSLEQLDWGLEHFKLTAQSTHPIPLSTKQREFLLSKLVELLPSQSNNLLQAYNRESDDLELVLK